MYLLVYTFFIYRKLLYNKATSRSWGEVKIDLFVLLFSLTTENNRTFKKLLLVGPELGFL